MKIPGITTWYVSPLVGWHSWIFEFDSLASNPSAVLEFTEKSPPGDFTGYGLDDVALVKFGPPRLSAENYPTIRLDGIVGLSYRIELSQTLMGTNGWKLLTEIALSRASYEFTDPGGQTPSRFYRAIQLP